MVYTIRIKMYNANKVERLKKFCRLAKMQRRDEVILSVAELEQLISYIDNLKEK